MSDEDIADLMRDADPARSLRDQRTEAQIDSDLRAICARPQVARRRRGRGPIVAVSAFFAFVTTIAIVVQLWSPFVGAASAATPPLLEVSPISQTLGDIMTEARSRLVTTTGSAERRASFEGWYLQTEVDAETSRSVITPEEQDVHWTADLSGSMTIISGQSYDPGAPPGTALPTDAAPPAGTVLRHEEYAPGEMEMLFQQTPPSDATEMRGYLATAIGFDPVDSDAYAYLSAIRVLLSEWTLDPQQHKALLDVLEGSSGVTIAGAVIDRLGRPGVALRATTPTTPQFEYLAIVSRETGAIIALETIYVGGSPELQVSTPSVIDYIAWK